MELEAGTYDRIILPRGAEESQARMVPGRGVATRGPRRVRSSLLPSTQVFGKIDINVKLEVRTRQAGEAWVAHCPAFDTCSQGETKEESIRSLQEAISGWFESCIEAEVLEEALAECGFWPARRASTRQYEATASSRLDSAVSEQIEVSVPAFVAAQLIPHEHAPC